MSAPFEPEIEAALRDPARLESLSTVVGRGLAPDEFFDQLTDRTADALQAPMAVMTLLTGERQYVISHRGLPLTCTSPRGIPVAHTFCRHVVASGEPVVVWDARADARVERSPLVAAESWIAYVGVPVRAPDGAILGALCVVDREPRTWLESEVDTLTELASAASREFTRRALPSIFDLVDGRR